MVLEDPPLIRRGELAQLIYQLNDPRVPGVLLLGGPGAGKTVLLRMAEKELKGEGRAALYISLRDMESSGGLGARILEAVEAVAPEVTDEPSRTILTSAGSPPIEEVVHLLRRAGTRMPSPVLLLDALDEVDYPARVASEIEGLSLALNEWRFVIASRPEGQSQVGQFARFTVIALRGLNQEEATTLLRLTAPELPEAELARIVDETAGNPLVLQMQSRLLREPTELPGGDRNRSSRSVIQRLVREIIQRSSEPDHLQQLLEELALSGGREQTRVLASKAHLSEHDVLRLLNIRQTGSLVILDQSAGTVAFVHDLISEFVLEARLLEIPFRLADLKFGAEEAEKDDLLTKSFVRRRHLELILQQGKSLVVGDRGSGKSAIFRLLGSDDSDVATEPSVRIYPIASAGDLLHRVVDKEAWLDADALRAAWLVTIASVVASAVPPSAPKELLRTANDLRAALGLPTQPVSLVQRMLRLAARPLGGTTLKFAVGPVNLEAKLPNRRTGGLTKSIDVEAFLDSVDALLGEKGTRVIVMFDRIDETFKYDRPKQEALVQALLQAESRLSMCERMGLLIFLRTDLFELYDLQEKNKLVSRTLTLEWSEEEWLKVFIRRVFANDPLERFAKILRVADDGMDIQAALRVLFPSEIEGHLVDRWLIDSLRNGNGDVSPRAAVLLLYLIREHSAKPDEIVNKLPIFSVEGVTTAMTKLSELSFSEVVNDFKVAQSFVLNCRAAKISRFVLDDVETLFDEAEGKRSEQVRLLERLGFLERTVEVGADGARSTFRIPKLYTRCWDNT
jgi:NACHT domain